MGCFGGSCSASILGRRTLASSSFFHEVSIRAALMRMERLKLRRGFFVVKLQCRHLGKAELGTSQTDVCSFDGCLQDCGRSDIVSSLSVVGTAVMLK